MDNIVLRNRDQSLTFISTSDGYRPEWFRLGDRVMLRFKDHELLKISVDAVVAGQVVEQSETAVELGGTVTFAGTPVDWRVRVSIPDDGGGRVPGPQRVCAAE